MEKKKKADESRKTILISIKDVFIFYCLTCRQDPDERTVMV